MKLIDLLIRLYPAEFRARYATQMRAFHRERMGEVGASLPSIIFDHLTSAMAVHMQSLIQDVRYTLRGLVRRPVFAAVVLATIALGVGANAAIFSVVNGILLRPLPYPDPNRLVSFGHKPPHWLAGERQYLDYQRDVAAFQSLSAYTQGEGNLADTEAPERITQAVVTRDFFSTIAVSPMLGRPFAEDEDRIRPAIVAILSHDLWQRRFGGDPAILGKTISYNGSPRTVIGVMPPNFDFPTDRTDIWLPMRRFNPDSLQDHGNHYLFLVGRLKPRMSMERVSQEANTVARRIMQDNPNVYDARNPLVPSITQVSDQLVGPTRPYLWALLGAVGFVLLIVCVNVANLLLARGEGRRKEMALRTALGATRSRLTTQLLTECLMLGVVGGAIGLALAMLGQRALVAVAPASIPRLDQIRVDWALVAYTVVISMVAALVFGLVPALRGAREAPAVSLKEGGKTASHGASRRMRRGLVIAEVALAVVMLAGAGMLLRSLLNLQSSDVGYDARGAFTAKVSPSQSNYSEPQTSVFYGELLQRIRAIPGVRAAGAANWLPVVGVGGLWGVHADGKTYPPAQQPALVPQNITPGYFKAMGMPIVAGRDITDADRAGGPYAVIISRAAAKLLWPEKPDALGQRFRIGGPESPMMTVVGIVGDIRSRGFQDTPEPTMYVPHAQSHESAYVMPRALSLVVRTAGDPMAIANQVRAIVRSLDATIPVSEARTLEQVVGTSVANRRFTTALIGAFALLALVLAGIGIFGVISYGVSERTFEIGVRMALGAERSKVMALIVGDGVRLALVGIVVGLVGAAGVGRAIRSMLVGISTIDVPTLLSVSAALAIVALVASIIPARRAMAVSPTEALRGG